METVCVVSVVCAEGDDAGVGRVCEEAVGGGGVSSVESVRCR